MNVRFMIFAKGNVMSKAKWRISSWKKWILGIVKWGYFLTKPKKAWVVFTKGEFDDQEIRPGDMGYELKSPDFMYRFRTPGADVSVMPGTFLSLNGYKPIRPLVRAVNHYDNSKCGCRRKQHLAVCIAVLQASKDKLDGNPVAQKEIENALDLINYYRPTISWKDYFKGEEYFLHAIGTAVLAIHGC